MNKNTKIILALILALVLLLTLAACKKGEESGEEVVSPTETESSSPPTTTTTDNTSPSPSPSPETSAPPTPQPEKTLVVGYSQFSQKFSYFFAKTQYDQDAAMMTQILLLDNDRAGNVILNGINGETLPYNGVDYHYQGIADISVVQKADGPVDYTITLRDDLVFSDGVPMTIDDVIFNMYVYSDPDYDGSVTFYSLPITGMNSYRTGLSTELYEKYLNIAEGILEAGIDNTNFSGWTQEQQDAFWGEYLDDASTKFVQEIVDYCVSNYGAYIGIVNDDEVALGMYVWGFLEEKTVDGDQETDEDGALVFDDDGEPVFEQVEVDGEFLTTITETEYSIGNGQFPTISDYWDEIIAYYGYELGDINDESAGSDIIDLVVSAFIAGEGQKDPEWGGEIINIAGIKKTGPYSCTVTTDYFEATSIYQFGFPVAPLHYYGDVNQYNYDNNMFGFPKGDLSIVRSKTTQPMGAGPYKFLSYESGVVSYEANENYYKGEPKLKYIRFQEVSDEDKLAGIIAGSIDITDPSFNKDAVDGIKGYNSNGDLTGDKITTSTVDNLGYGYIGICADTVNVGGDPGSEASKYLRTAFATLYAVYRDMVTNSYYGERASTIQYPISNTSWAAPRPNDEGYRVAYSRDVDGNDIYTDSMTEQEKYAAALDAAIGFLKAAGYTWDDASGMFTAAPAGAQMAYEVIIPADGKGDHPAYGILTAAKEALNTIGLTLEINDPVDSNVLWNSIEAGTAEMWVAAWVVTIDPDMYQVYHSSNIVGRGGTDSNHYAVDDPLLDELIFEARTSDNQAYRKATYKQCLDIIMDWAVEVPNYQRQNAEIFSTERVNISTITPDIATFWDWMHDLEKLEMN